MRPRALSDAVPSVDSEHSPRTQYAQGIEVALDLVDMKVGQKIVQQTTMNIMYTGNYMRK